MTNRTIKQAIEIWLLKNFGLGFLFQCPRKKK